MLALISSQVSKDEAICEQIGLVEGKTQSLARDCIDAARGVSYQSNISCPHARQLPSHRDGSPFHRTMLGTGQLCGGVGEGC